MLEVTNEKVVNNIYSSLMKQCLCQVMCTILVPFSNLKCIEENDLLIAPFALTLTGGFYHWTDITIDGHGKYCLNNNVDI